MESHQRTLVSQVLPNTPLLGAKPGAVESLRFQFLRRLKGIVQNASEILTPTESLPALTQPAKNPVTEAAERVVSRRWNPDELCGLKDQLPEVVYRFQDEVRRLIQKSRCDVERAMTPEELIELRQEEQHYEERLKIRMKQRTLNIPWPQRGEVMQAFEARLIARIERCLRYCD